MGLIYDEVLRFLREDEWPVLEVGDGVTVSTAFEGQGQRWVCLAQAVEEAGVLIFYSILPIETPPQRRDVVAQFLCYASYNVPSGSFELSHEDGDVRFKNSLSVLGLEPQVLEGGVLQQLIKNVAYANVLTMEAHVEAIGAVVGGQEPAQVLEALSA